MLQLETVWFLNGRCAVDVELSLPGKMRLEAHVLDACNYVRRSRSEGLERVEKNRVGVRGKTFRKMGFA